MSSKKIYKQKGRILYLGQDAPEDITSLVENEVRLRMEVERQLKGFSDDIEKREMEDRIAKAATQVLCAKKELRDLIRSCRKLFVAYVRNERLQETFVSFKLQLESAEKWLLNDLSAKK